MCWNESSIRELLFPLKDNFSTLNSPTCAEITRVSRNTQLRPVTLAQPTRVQCRSQKQPRGVGGRRGEGVMLFLREISARQSLEQAAFWDSLHTDTHLPLFRVVLGTDRQHRQDRILSPKVYIKVCFKETKQ
jgi:hypothetical protein